MAKFCPNCGTGLDEAAKFCMGCGTSVAAAAPAPESAPYPQQPIPQPYPQYPQQPYAPAEPPKKKRKGLKIFLGILGGLVALIAVIIVTASAATGSAAKKDYYELGNDKVPSVKLVLGEKRKITNVSSSITNGQIFKGYQYAVSTGQAAEMQAYAAYLLGEDDFYILPDEDEDAFAILGRNSVDEGQCITMVILCDDTGYAITIVKDAGQINAAGGNQLPSEPADPNNNYDPNNFPEGNLEDPVLDGVELWAGVWQHDTTANTQNIHLYNNGTFMIETYKKDGSGDDFIRGDVHYENGELTFYNAENSHGSVTDFAMFFERVDPYTAHFDGLAYELILEEGD